MLIDKHSIFTAAAMEKAHFRPQKNFILQKTIDAQKKLPFKIDKYNWIQIIEGNLLLKSKDSNLNICLESGDGLGFEVDYYDDVSIDTEKDLDFLLFSMPSL